VKSFRKKIEETNNINLYSDEELQKLFFDIFVKESSDQRGIVGKYSITLSKKSVVGIVLAIASIADIFVSGAMVSSVIISSGGMISAISSAVSKLTKEELEIIGLISSLQSEIHEPPTVKSLLNNSE
jgi:hypothetical protein